MKEKTAGKALSQASSISTHGINLKLHRTERELLTRAPDETEDAPNFLENIFDARVEVDFWLADKRFAIVNYNIESG
jgi:hypothetical protein